MTLPGSAVQHRVRVALLLCAVAPAATAAGFIDECGAKTSCEDCLMEGAHNFCGWCSPGPVIYASGKPGKRCADERDSPWDCPQHYMTKSCPAKYTCNATAGACIHACGDVRRFTLRDSPIDRLRRHRIRYVLT